MKGAKWLQGGAGKEAVKGFLAALLEKGTVSALLMPGKNKTGDSYSWFLADSPAFFESLDPIPPVMTTQGARIVKNLTGKEPVAGKTAVVLRPCELRAALELVKLRQVNLGNLVTISFDCPGAYPLKKYFRDNREDLDRRYETSLGNKDLDGARPACCICHRFTGEKADIHVGLLGSRGDGFWIIPGSQAGRELVEELDGQAADNLDCREKAVERLRKERSKAREEILKGFQESVHGTENLMKMLASCINCHNCSRVCPLCFCQECYFDSAALRSEGDNLLSRAQRKGGLRLPPDVLFFHLGRMNHMSISCVSCGACEDACPADIPVSMVFSLVGRETQTLFDYEPGRSLEEPIPYTVYDNEELKEWEAPYIKRPQAL